LFANSNGYSRIQIINKVGFHFGIALSVEVHRFALFLISVFTGVLRNIQRQVTREMKISVSCLEAPTF